MIAVPDPVEAVAKAIHYAREARDPTGWNPDVGSDGEGGIPGAAFMTPWEDLGEADRRDIREQAKAALAASSQPVSGGLTDLHELDLERRGIVPSGGPEGDEAVAEAATLEVMALLLEEQSDTAPDIAEPYLRAQRYAVAALSRVPADGEDESLGRAYGVDGPFPYDLPGQPPADGEHG